MGGIMWPTCTTASHSPHHTHLITLAHHITLTTSHSPHYTCRITSHSPHYTCHITSHSLHHITLTVSHHTHRITLTIISHSPYHITLTHHIILTGMLLLTLLLSRSSAILKMLHSVSALATTTTLEPEFRRSPIHTHVICGGVEREGRVGGYR